MPSDGKKGITVKIDEELHAEVRQYLDSHEMTMAEFVTLALQDELHPKITTKEEKYMGNMKMLAVQIPENLFQKIKDYLHRNNMTQKEFVIGLIQNELKREQTERENAEKIPEENKENTEQKENSSVSDSETIYGDSEDNAEEQDENNFSDVFDTVSEESENYNESEDENMGFSMGM